MTKAIIGGNYGPKRVGPGGSMWRHKCRSIGSVRKVAGYGVTLIDGRPWNRTGLQSTSIGSRPTPIAVGRDGVYRPRQSGRWRPLWQKKEDQNDAFLGASHRRGPNWPT